MCVCYSNRGNVYVYMFMRSVFKVCIGEMNECFGASKPCNLISAGSDQLKLDWKRERRADHFRKFANIYVFYPLHLFSRERTIQFKFLSQWSWRHITKLINSQD